MRFGRRPAPGYRSVPSDDRRGDAEHYLRLVQAEIDRHLERTPLSRPALRAGDPAEIESRLVGRALDLADRLGRTLSELWAWLDQVPTRPRVMSPRARGREEDESQRPGWTRSDTLRGGTRGGSRGT